MTHIQNGRQKSSDFRLPSAEKQTPYVDQPKSVRHYRLTNQEWLKANKELKPSEVKVLYYLRTLDPWGDKNLDIGVRALAQDLDCSPGTISKALKALDQKHWIDLEITSARVRLRTDTPKADRVELSNTKDVFPDGNSVSVRKQISPSGNKSVRQETNQSVRKQSAPETHTEQGVQIALNSLKLIRPTTPEVCVSSNVNNSETRTEVGVFDRPLAQVKTTESSNEAIPPDEDTYTPPILLAVKKKFQINLGDPHLRRALERWPERLDVAIACLEEKEITVKHPTRFLQKAIEEQWQPEALAKEKAPDEFQDWFKEARERGLVVGSQRIDGIIMVYTVDERCVPFHELRQQSWEALTAELQPITADSPPVNTAPPEQVLEPSPEPEPAVSTILHRVNNAIVTQSPISPQLQADAERCHIDISLLQTEWKLAASPPGSAADDMRQAG